jgi:hypothetical protein
MAHFRLEVHGDLEELADIAAALGGYQTVTTGPGPAPVDAAGLSAAAEKPVRGKKKTEPGAGAVEAATAASPATERPTPAVQQTAEQIAHVDPAVLAAQQGGDPAAPGSPSNKPAETPAAEPVKTEEPVVEEPAETAEPVTGEVTRDMLNVAMTELLKVTSAAKAQATIAEAAGGKKALGALDVSEYPAVLQALKNATAAASAA